MIPNEYLQPMGIGELLDKSIKLFRKQFFRFVTIAAIGFIPLTLMGIFTIVFAGASSDFFSGPFNPYYFPNASPGFWGIWLLLIILGSLSYGLTRLSLIKASQETMFENQVTLGQCFKTGLQRLIPYLVTGILLFFAITLGFILLIIPGVIFLIWFSLFEPVLVLENSGYIRGLRRSKFLVKGYFWRTFGFFMVTFLLSFAVTGILSQILGLIPVVGQIFNLLFQLIVLPFQIIAETLYYYNQRTIKEGLDLTLTTDNVLAPEGDA